jgi:hypothetical protein
MYVQHLPMPTIVIMPAAATLPRPLTPQEPDLLLPNGGRSVSPAISDRCPTPQPPSYETVAIMDAHMKVQEEADQLPSYIDCANAGLFNMPRWYKI